VHELMKPEQALDFYQTMRHETAGVRS
jgi:hypothetical protein